MVEKIYKTDAEWKAQLTQEQYEITRRKGTEPPFCDGFHNHELEGTYYCICCDLPLFSSGTKFISGTGWPSFFTPINEDYIEYHEDTSLGRIRTEVVCARCVMPTSGTFLTMDRSLPVCGFVSIQPHYVLSPKMIKRKHDGS